MRLLTLRLRNITPMLVGWYEPNKADYMGLRTTEIKGIWRWWARAFIGGALYDKGLLRGISTRDILLKPNYCEARLISRLVGVDLGLGLVFEKEAMASRFKLYAEPVQKIRVKRSSELGRWADVQRVRLLTIKRSIEVIPENHEFVLHIEWLRKFEHAETALKILVIALQLTGIGKGSRRGLGSLDIVSLEGEADVADRLRKKGRPEDFKAIINEVYKECGDIVSAKERDLEKDLRKCRDEGLSTEGLPPLPVVSKSKISAEIPGTPAKPKPETAEVPVTMMKVFPNVDEELFPSIHNFFVRSERCRVLYGTPICEDELREGLNAWFLGLPRSQRRTGYVTEVARRASPIHLTFHTNDNAFSGGAFVTIFLSGDWPRTISWYGGEHGMSTINITKQRIVEAYSTFEREFRKYMSRINVGREVVLWP